MVLNRAYVHLVRNLDREQREEFDADLYAPEEGRDAAEADILRKLDELTAEVAQ